MSCEPELRLYMSMMALDSFPPSSSGPRGNFEEQIQGLAAAGFSGVQVTDCGIAEELGCCRRMNLGIAMSHIETHRATICQGMWRTVQFVKRFPELRFNGDFSHWYAGNGLRRL